MGSPAQPFPPGAALGRGRWNVFYLASLFRQRAGRVKIALSRSKTALTVMPSKRKGSDRSQTIGYRIRATRASGQHRTNKINQSKNFNISQPFFFFVLDLNENPVLMVHLFLVFLLCWLFTNNADQPYYFLPEDNKEAGPFKKSPFVSTFSHW